MSAHILIVEDEAALVELLRYNLEKEGSAWRSPPTARKA